jgi:hypothetical protein
VRLTTASRWNPIAPGRWRPTAEAGATLALIALRGTLVLVRSESSTPRRFAAFLPWTPRCAAGNGCAPAAYARARCRAPFTAASLVSSISATSAARTEYLAQHEHRPVSRRQLLEAATNASETASLSS